MPSFFPSERFQHTENTAVGRGPGRQPHEHVLPGVERQQMIKIKIDFSNGPVRLLHAPDDACEVADGVDWYSFLRIGLAMGLLDVPAADPARERPAHLLL